MNIYDSHVIRFGEDLVNTFALRQRFPEAAGERLIELGLFDRGSLTEASNRIRRVAVQ